VDPLEIQKSQINSLLQLSRAGHYGAQPGSKSSSYAPPYYGAPGIGFMMPYGSSSISSPLLPGSPLVGNAFSLRQADPRIPIGAGKNNIYMGTSSESGEELKGSTLLEELKNNKTRKFELADIAGHVIEFR
jgi:pumilio RNA-binding family